MSNCPFGATRTEFGGVAGTTQPVPLAHLDSSTRLRNVVHQATSQVQRCPRDFGDSPRCPCPVRALMPADRGRYPPPAVALPSPPAGCLVPGLPLPQARRSREITPPDRR